MIDSSTLGRLLPDCLCLAREAGEAILAVARDSLDVRDKQDGSPLTRADRASHDIIVAGLAKLQPTFAILSEEGDVSAFAADPPAAFWCVDPLDGTKEFIQGRDEYTVNIALVADSGPVLGVIVAPAMSTAWWAAAGCGAWKQAGAGEPTPIAPAAKPRPEVAVASRSHLSDQTRGFLERNAIERTRSHGSSLKMTAVADGSADVYPRHGPTCLWDTAAGAAICRQAGCRVLALDGEPLSYDPRAGLKREGFLVIPEGMAFDW